VLIEINTGGSAATGTYNRRIVIHSAYPTLEGDYRRKNRARYPVMDRKPMRPVKPLDWQFWVVLLASIPVLLVHWAAMTVPESTQL
jgi:hypothetical protein